jgi:hypothetical protein
MAWRMAAVGFVMVSERKSMLSGMGSFLSAVNAVHFRPGWLAIEAGATHTVPTLPMHHQQADVFPALWKNPDHGLVGRSLTSPAVQVSYTKEA